MLTKIVISERVGVEPTERLRSHDFESCSLDHSDTSPENMIFYRKKRLCKSKSETNKTANYFFSLFFLKKSLNIFAASSPMTPPLTSTL